MSKLLKKSDRLLFEFVKGQVEHHARMFNLPLRSVSPLPRKKCWYYGKCNKHGDICIRVRNSNSGDKWGGLDLPYQIIDTMSHELAHLLTVEHSNEWFELHTRILYVMAAGNTFSNLTHLCKKIKANEKRRRK
jgi:hypothetical protein